jgi:hypothetical protein
MVIKIIVLVLLFSGLALFEIPKLIRKKQWPELISSCVLLCIGFLLSLLQVIGVEIPNPDKVIASLIKMITQ